MPSEQWLTALGLSLALLAITIQLVRWRKLREEYALLWLIASTVIFILSVATPAVGVLSSLFEVAYAPTLILTLGLLFALAILLSQSVIVTTLTDHVRDLAQHLSILDWQVRQLKTKVEIETKVETEVTLGAKTKVIGSDQHPASGESATDEGSHKQPASQHAAQNQVATVSRRNGSHRLLVIGVDGATLDLIEPWADDGYLPTMRRIMHNGSFGQLRSTIPPMTAPAWTSFATGTNPGKHGLYDWIARKADCYRYSPVTALDCATPTIYTLLSQAGRRVCTLNVPMTYPPVPINGLMVSGMPAPSTRAAITYPSTFYGELLQAIGEYILYPDPGQAYSDSGVDAFLKRLHRCGELRARAFDYLRDRDKWDFAMVVFSGTDTVCHAMWKFMDPSHPLHDPSRRAKYGNAIRTYYQFVDDYLGKIVESLDDETTLIIMSDHGFGPFHKFIHVNNWLIQTGLMHLRPGWRAGLKAGLFRRGFAPMNIYDALMRLGLGSLKKETVRGQGMNLLATLFLSFDDVDWGRTRAYSLGNVGQINLNVKGREPMGCVHPGTEYQRVRDEVIAHLVEMRDPETGEKVAEAIYRREEVYSGDQLEKAPDILFIPRRLEYFGFGEYEFGSHKIIEAMRRGISGTHRMDGIVLAYGRAIRSGQRLNGAQITDLAPTALHLLGEPVPEHMDGRVLREMLSDDFEPARPPQEPNEWHAPASGGTEHLTAEDERILAERLRALGYVA